MFEIPSDINILNLLGTLTVLSSMILTRLTGFGNEAREAH